MDLFTGGGIRLTPESPHNTPRCNRTPISDNKLRRTPADKGSSTLSHESASQTLEDGRFKLLHDVYQSYHSSTSRTSPPAREPTDPPSVAIGVSIPELWRLCKPLGFNPRVPVPPKVEDAGDLTVPAAAFGRARHTLSTDCERL